MDAETLQALVLEQGRIIEELRSQQGVQNEAMKSEILASLKKELSSAPSTRRKKGKKYNKKTGEPRTFVRHPTSQLPVNPLHFTAKAASYDDEEYDYGYSIDYEEGEESLPTQPQSMIIRSNSLQSMPTPATSSSLRASTGRKLKRTHSSEDKSTKSSTHGELDDSPFTLSANPSNQFRKKPVSPSRRKKGGKSKASVPLAPTNMKPDDEPEDVKLGNSTMLFLHQSAKVVGDATGKRTDVIMAQTFSQPLPERMKKPPKSAKAATTKTPATPLDKPSTSQENFVSASNSVTFSAAAKGSERHSMPAASWFESSNLATPSSLPVVKGGSKRGFRSPSRAPTSRNTLSTAGSTKKSRPRTVGPSTVATVRSEAESLGAKLLGPLNLDGERKKAPLPSSLDENEWENELARNILSLYSNQVVEEIKAKKEVRPTKQSRRM